MVVEALLSLLFLLLLPLPVKLWLTLWVVPALVQWQGPV